MEDSSTVCFLCGTVPGRGILKAIQTLRLDIPSAPYLRSAAGSGTCNAGLQPSPAPLVPERLVSEYGVDPLWPMGILNPVWPAFWRQKNHRRSHRSPSVPGFSAPWQAF